MLRMHAVFFFQHRISSSLLRFLSKYDKKKFFLGGVRFFHVIIYVVKVDPNVGGGQGKDDLWEIGTFVCICMNFLLFFAVGICFFVTIKFNIK
jgi:hypothetical protein